MIETINIHLWPKCNLSCVYCFGKFPARPPHLDGAGWKPILLALANHGVKRISFSGGEPTFHPDLLDLLRHTRALGLQTSVITNGARLSDAMLGDLDLVGITIDSTRPSVLKALGRGEAYLEAACDLARRTHAAGVRLKVNTVVCSLNVDENLVPLILELRPVKWKPLQFTFVAGEHGEAARSLAISGVAFDRFVDRNRAVERAGVWLAPERDTTIQKTYVMLDPMGRVFQHGPHGHILSPPVTEVGLTRALETVGGYDRWAFLDRGGDVDVRRLPVLQGGGA